MSLLSNQTNKQLENSKALAELEARENENNRKANYDLAMLEANTTATLTAMDNLKASKQTFIIIIAVIIVGIAIFYFMKKKQVKQ